MSGLTADQRRQHHEQGFVVLERLFEPEELRPVKSAREPGFLARSRQRPDEVITTLDGYLRIREAAAAYARTPGIRL